MTNDELFNRIKVELQNWKAEQDSNYCAECDDDWDEEYNFQPPTKIQRAKNRAKRFLRRFGMFKPSTCDAVLEEAYMPAIKEELNRQSMLLAKIEGK